MNITILIYLSLSFIHIAFSQTSQAFLSLYWFGGYCQQVGDCRPEVYRAWNKYECDYQRHSFIINGFETVKKSNANFGALNATMLTHQFFLYANMSLYWPSRTRINYSQNQVWQKQFQTNAPNFLDIYLKNHAKDFTELSQTERNNELQIIYFDEITKLFRKMRNLRHILKGQYTKSQFSKETTLSSKQFSIVCNKFGSLTQIKICYQINYSGIVLSNCKNAVQNINCPQDSFRLEDWEEQANYTVAICFAAIAGFIGLAWICNTIMENELLFHRQNDERYYEMREVLIH